MSENSLAQIPSGKPEMQISDNEWKLISRYLAPGATPEETEFLLMQCKSLGLDPRRNQVYLIVTGKGEGKRYSLYTSSAQVRMMVLNSPLLDLLEGPFYAEKPEPGKEPDWQKYWAGSSIPFLCMVRVKRRGVKFPLETVRYFREVAQKYRDGNLVEKWKNRPLEEFARVTFRKAFSENFFDVVAGVGAYEDMADDIGEFVEVEGDEVKVIASETGAEFRQRFDKLGWNDEQREQFLAQYGNNQAAALYKLDQVLAAQGTGPLASTADELPSTGMNSDEDALRRHRWDEGPEEQPAGPALFEEVEDE